MSTPATIETRRRRLRTHVLAAAVTAVAIWALLSFAVDRSGRPVAPSAPRSAAIALPA